MRTYKIIFLLNQKFVWKVKQKLSTVKVLSVRLKDAGIKLFYHFVDVNKMINYIKTLQR